MFLVAETFHTHTHTRGRKELQSFVFHINLVMSSAAHITLVCSKLLYVNLTGIIKSYFDGSEAGERNWKEVLP